MTEDQRKRLEEMAKGAYRSAFYESLECPTSVRCFMAGAQAALEMREAEIAELKSLIAAFLKEAKLVKAYGDDCFGVQFHPNDFKPLTTTLISRAEAILNPAPVSDGTE